jgi:hypothetical protein
MNQTASRLLLSSLLFGATSQFASAQVFSDNFTADTSLGPEWFNMVNSTSASFALNPTAGQGLALNVNSGATGKTDEAFAQFTPSPVTLMSAGDSVTLTVDFNSPNLSANTGGLLVGLYNTGGNPATANLSGTATGGATAAHTGYFGIMGYNTTAGTSTKFFSRQGGVSDANELGYYSTMTSGSTTQLGSYAASGNANLANNTGYVLTYTITKGASSDSVMAVIQQGSTTLDSWSFTDATGAYNSFDELDFGTYGKNAAVNANVTQITVTDSISAVVPEPATYGFIGAGLLAAVYRRRLINL